MHICLFDIDGTLLSSGGAGQAAMEAAIASEFATSRAVEGISTAGRTDRAIMSDLFRYFDIEPEDSDWSRFIAAYLSHLPRHLANRPGLVLPGVPELLAGLAAREDVLLGLLTGNLCDGAKVKLGHFGLHDYFVLGGFGDRHLDRDDVAREAYDVVCRHLNGAAPNKDKVWVIGDTPADVRCGRAIGAKVVAVATGSYRAEELRSHRPDHLFENFADYEAVLALFE